MTDIEPVLKRLGLQQYLDDFIAEGFDSWATLLDIQETDLEHLNVKLGHRRKLQRAIAEWRGLGVDKPLGPPSHDASVADLQRPEGILSEAGSSKEVSSSTATEQKRKYRRHPKHDENAPEKPPSAYVLFSNRIREEVKSENLSFTDIARLVGERWQKLDPAQKDYFDSHASALKETYNTQLAEYKKTDAYKAYAQYLVDFKAKHANTNEPKRPKLELKTSSSVSGTSQGESSDAPLPLPGHIRGASFGSSSTTSYAGQIGSSTATPPQLSSLMVSGHAPIRRASPSYPNPQERRFVGHFSSQSSVSEESLSARTDHGDALSRAATLSLTTPPAETPSPPVTSGHIVNRPDFSLASTYSPVFTRWPLQGYSQSTSSTAPGSITTSPLASVGGGSNSDTWRDRNQEALRSPHSQNMLQGMTPPTSLPISHLVAPNSSNEPGNFPSRRALPPPRQLAGTANQAQFGVLGSLFQPQHTPFSSSDVTPIRHGQSRELPTRVESEVVDTLSGSSEQQSAEQQPWIPHSRSEERR